MSGLETSSTVAPLKVGAATEFIERHLPAEEPVAIVCNGTTLAVNGGLKVGHWAAQNQAT